MTCCCNNYFTLCCSAYRKACLEHHPDKKLVGVECEKAKEDAEEHFKKVGDAPLLQDLEDQCAFHNGVWHVCAPVSACCVIEVMPLASWVRGSQQCVCGS